MEVGYFFALFLNFLFEFGDGFGGDGVLGVAGKDGGLGSGFFALEGGDGLPEGSGGMLAWGGGGSFELVGELGGGG